MSSIKEIYTRIKANQANLLHIAGVINDVAEYDDYIDAVNSNSKMADHDHWVYQFAYNSKLERDLQDAFKAEIEALADTEEIGTGPWWDRVVKEWQVFDPIVVVDGKTTYSVIDATKQITVRRSIKQDEAGKVIVKVAKEESPGVLGRLDDAEDNDEFGSLLSYLTARQPFGVDFSLISLDADKLRVYGNIYYDPIRDIDDVKSVVQAAIELYLSELDFDGKVYVRKLTDYIQEAAGVLDLSPITIDGISGSVSVTSDRVYETASGYIIEDPDLLFLDSLTFIPFES